MSPVSRSSMVLRSFSGRTSVGSPEMPTDFAVGDGFDIVELHAAPVRHGLDKLSEHIIDQRLHISLLGGSEVARGSAGILEFASLDYDTLQLGPLQQVAIVYPLRDHADRAHNAALVGIDLIRGRSHVIRAAGAHALDGNHDTFLFFLADPFHFAINLFRSSHAPTR